MSNTLKHYEQMDYPYTVMRQHDGVFYISFPDLPGCVTQVSRPEEIAEAAEEIRLLWIETELERGATIPRPSVQVEYSGKFVARMPRQLHRDLAEAAARQGCSLNQYVVHLLSQRDITDQFRRDLEKIHKEISVIGDRLPYHISAITSAPKGREKASYAITMEQAPVAA